MTSKIKIFDQNLLILAVLRGIFGHFGVEKVVLWTFLKLFGSCLASV